MPYFDLVTFLAVTTDRLRRSRSRTSWSLVGWQLASIPLVHAGMALDRWLVPGLAHVPVREPLFLVGNFRAGTTLLLRLLACDPASACFSTLELGIPSLVLRRALRARFRRWAAAMLEHHLAPLDDIHPVRLSEPEEEELLFLHLGNAAHYELLAPLGGLAARRVRAPWTWPPRKRARFMAFHRACVQRLLYERGAARYVGKSPHFGGRVADLHHAYPDARFVYLVRSPLESIPSALSMAAAFWRAAGIDARRECEAMMALYHSLVALYRHTERAFAALPRDRVVTVRYPDLVADPSGTVARIYQRFGWPLERAAAARIGVEAAKAVRWSSRHRYRVEDFALDPHALACDLGFLFDEHGFPLPAGQARPDVGPARSPQLTPSSTFDVPDQADAEVPYA